MTERAEHPLPAAGGSYVREPDGTLTHEQDVKPAPKPKAAKAADNKEG